MRAVFLVFCRIGVAALVATISATGGHSRELSLATSPVYSPYKTIVEQIFQNAGYTTVTKIYPLERAIYLAEKGEVDGVFFRTREAFANKQNLKFIGPVGCADVSAFFLKGHDIKISSNDDFRRYRVAIRLGDKLAEAFVAKTKTMSTLVVDDIDLLKIVKSERVDLALLPMARGMAVAKNTNMTDYIDQPVTVSTSPLYIVLINAESNLEESLNKALIDMKNSGSFARQVGDINQSLGLPRWYGVECPGD